MPGLSAKLAGTIPEVLLGMPGSMPEVPEVLGMMPGVPLEVPGMMPEVPLEVPGTVPKVPLEVPLELLGAMLVSRAPTSKSESDVRSFFKYEFVAHFDPEIQKTLPNQFPHYIVIILSVCLDIGY